MVRLEEETKWGALLVVSLQTLPMAIEGVRSIGAQMGRLMQEAPKGSPEAIRLGYLLSNIGGIHQILQATDGMAHALATDLLGERKDPERNSDKQ